MSIYNLLTKGKWERPTDQSAAQGLVEALESIPVLRVVEDATEDQALDALRRGDRSLVVILPETEQMAAAVQGAFSRPVVTDDVPSAPIRVYYDEGQAQVAQAGMAVINQVAEEFNRQITQMPQVLRVECSGLNVDSGLGMFDFLLPGIVAMTLMQTGLMGVTWVVASYRERRLLKRILATPFPPFAFLTGMVARFTITNLIQATVIVLIGVGVFKAQIVGSWLNLALLAAIGSVTFLAMGFAISTLSKTSESANNLGSAIAFPMMFLSGTFWPREMIPDFLQPVLQFLPLTPLVDAMRGVAAHGDTLAMHLGGIGYMLVWIVGAVLIATWRFRWE